MKYLFYSSLLALGLAGTGCMQKYLPTENRLSLLPTPYHDKEVEVYFPGEYPQDSSYVKVAILEQRAEGAVAYGTLVEAVKKKAKQQGMDAVLLLNKNQSTRLQKEGLLAELIAETIAGRELEDEYTSVTTHELAGVGIKFRKNLHYLPEYLQKKQVYAVEGETEALLASVEIDHQGIARKVTAATATDEQTYERYVHQYDLQHLLQETGPQWRYRQVVGQIRKRKLRGPAGAPPLKKVKIQYNELLLPHRLELTTSPDPQPETIEITYNEQRQVMSKAIRKDGQVVLKEVNSFGPGGKLQATLHYKVEDGKDQPFLKTVYHYYPSAAL
ncbi:hypothetical protein [Rufibacter psychrotolerans]|uniref:hypothetical protein n=1 Tax=Rufibacter psychrotolerans TaxID=2812556 RepID=UPI00196779A8|nr:hypothetical protein [Rufibacter sp. SYSU D00308]